MNLRWTIEGVVIHQFRVLSCQFPVYKYDFRTAYSFRLLRDRTVTAFKVDQRIGVADDDVFDLAEEYRVVAAIEGFEKAALKGRERACQDRDAVLVNGVFDAGELILNERREMLGDGGFIGGKDVHREPARLLKSVMAAGRFFDADQDERRIKRHRAKRRYGDAKRLFPRILCGYDGDPASESGQGGTKIG